MTKWRTFIDPSVGDGQNTINGIIADGSAFGVGISDDLNVTGLSTFSDVARFSSTVRLDGQLRDGDNAFGSSGQVLSSDGTDTRWVNAGSLSAGAASLVAINDDSNTNANRFITFVDSSSGNNSIKTDPQLTYNPSTNVISTAGIELNDDKEIVFGDNSDLKIFHDPSSGGGSRIEHSGHDDLRLRIGGNQMVFEKTNNDNFIVMTHSNGEVELCHATSGHNVKLTTTSSGVTITGTATATAFSGPLTGNVTGNISGNAGSATILANARTIGGVSFNGSANINLPGVNQAGNQNTSGNAATATVLETTRNFSISGEITANAQSFNGSGNVTLSATVDNNVIDEANLKISNSPQNGFFLKCNTGVSGGLTWSEVSLPTAATLDGTTLASGITASSITSLGTLTGLTVNGNISQTGQTTISRGFTSDTDFQLYLRQTTNGEGATIKFADDTNATQFGLFTYNHQDVKSNSAGNSFHFDSSESSTAVIIDQTSGNSGFYVGTNRVFHQGNDGPGSGLDSDKLDSQEGSYYRDADNLNAGTIPDARFPSTLPALNGSNLTNLNASNISSGTIAAARLPNHSAALLTSGTIPAARVPTLNQNTTGSAATLTTARTIAGTSFNGSANISINYNNLTNKPTIPTNNNQLTNGRGFITATDVRSMNEATSTGQSSTTSTSFQNKVTLSISTVSNSRVLIAYAFEIKHSNTNNHSCKAQVNGSNVSFVGGNLEESESDNDFQRFTGTILDIGSHTGTRTYRIQFRATNNSGQIQNASLTAIEMSV